MIVTAAYRSVCVPVSKVDPLDVEWGELGATGEEASASGFEQSRNHIFNVSVSERFVFEV